MDLSHLKIGFRKSRQKAPHPLHLVPHYRNGEDKYRKRHVCLNLLSWLMRHGTMFFSHNKSDLADLSAAETISQTARSMHLLLLLILAFCCSCWYHRVWYDMSKNSRRILRPCREYAWTDRGLALHSWLSKDSSINCTIGCSMNNSIDAFSQKSICPYFHEQKKKGNFAAGHR